MFIDVHSLIQMVNILPIGFDTSPYIVINDVAFTMHYLQTWMCLQDFTGFLVFFFHWKSREPKLRHWFSYQNAPVNGNFCSPTNCGCCLRVLQVDRRGEDWWWKQHPTWGEIAKKYGIWWIYKLYTWLMLSETSTLQSRNCYFRQLNIRDTYIYYYYYCYYYYASMHACMHAFIHTCIHTCIHT